MIYSFLSFLRGPMKDALSCGVWKRPCPNFELVSMNLRLIFSRYLFLVWVNRDFLNNNPLCKQNISTEFLVLCHAQHLFSDLDQNQTKNKNIYLWFYKKSKNYLSIAITLMQIWVYIKINRIANLLWIHMLSTYKKGSWVNYLDPYEVPESEEPLLVTDARPLDEKEVLLHLSVVRESTHRVNGFISQVITEQI